MAPSRKPVSIRFDESLMADVEDHLEQSDETKADFFENAVEQYLGQDRYYRVESKIDAIHDELDIEWTLSSTEETEKKESEETSVDPFSDEALKEGPLPIDNKQTDGKANRMVNYLLLKFPSTPMISESDFMEPIHRIGGTTDHYEEQYPPLIRERLNDLDWTYNPINKSWYRDDELLETNLKEQWGDAKRVAKGKEGIRDVSSPGNIVRQVENESEVTDLLEEYGIGTPEVRADVFSDLDSRVPRREEARKRLRGDI